MMLKISIFIKETSVTFLYPLGRWPNIFWWKYTQFGAKKFYITIIALQGTKKLQRFLWWKCCFFAPIQLVFPFFLPPWAQHYSSMLLCSCSYMYLVATKKNHVKISTQSKATVDWMGTVFSPKMSLFFLATQLCSPICSTSKWPNDLIFVFWGPQTCYRVH